MLPAESDGLDDLKSTQEIGSKPVKMLLQFAQPHRRQTQLVANVQEGGDSSIDRVSLRSWRRFFPP
jgi:hypothetical protein